MTIYWFWWKKSSMRSWWCVRACVFMSTCDAFFGNMIFPGGKLEKISFLLCGCTTLSTRALLFLVVVKCYSGTTRVKMWNIVNMMLQEVKFWKNLYLMCRCTTLKTKPRLFLAKVNGNLRSSVSICENTVNRIFQEGKFVHISYMVYLGVAHQVQEPMFLCLIHFGVLNKFECFGGG